MFNANTDYHCPCPSARWRIDKPSLKKLSYFKNIRKNVKTFVDSKTTTTRATYSFKRAQKGAHSRLMAIDFNANKPEHVSQAKRMGITVILLDDGRVQLVHNSAQAYSVEDAVNGDVFMQEMIALSKHHIKEDKKLRTVSFSLPSKLGFKPIKITLLAGPAQFGYDFEEQQQRDPVHGEVVKVVPFDGCHLEAITNRKQLRGKIAIVKRGKCMFIEKARHLQHLGSIGMIVIDNSDNSSSKTMPMFSMSTDGSDDVTIASVFLYTEDAKLLLAAIDEHPKIDVRIDILTEELHQSLEKSTDRNLYEQFLKNTVKRANLNNLEQIDLSTIMNMLKSNKLKFDLLKSLNDRMGEDVLEVDYWPNQFHIKLSMIAEDVTHCGNPFRQAKLFATFMTQFVYLCLF